MSTGSAMRDRAATRLGAAGAALGVVAGTVQALGGARIPEWTGAKQAPLSLGLLTILLSLLAGYAAHRQARPNTTVMARAAYAAALLIPALLCFSTVGRLWYLPGPLLLAAALFTSNLHETSTLMIRNWLRCLLAALGASELLMAAGAAPVLMAVGAIGGAALIAGATVTRSRASLITLVLVGTVPFAALAWTAMIPVLLLLAAAAVATPMSHRTFSRAVVRP